MNIENHQPAGRDDAWIADLLVRHGLLGTHERITAISKAGEGNMNLVLRVQLSGKSLVIKRSRPWVEKYPSIAAPVERIFAEMDFYDRVRMYPSIARRMPKVLATDRESHCLVMEDLGAAADYWSLYEGADSRRLSIVQHSAEPDVFDEAIRWSAALHQIAVAKADRQHVGCFALRQLNHSHIFDLPVRSTPVIDLDAVCPGLADGSHFIRDEDGIRDAMRQLGQRYLDGGGYLLHGDFYPGSWLRTSQGFAVIDPEFCFAGDIEFELGVLVAHRIFSGAPYDISMIKESCQRYRRHHSAQLNEPLVARFVAAELIRRLLGVAQLPINADLSKRIEWLSFAKSVLICC